jgi:hypothetical protein
MDRTCDVDNPLVRDGLTQVRRALPALGPSYFQIDERSIPELLCYTHRWAKQLQYYDRNNRPAGDWQAFLGRDVVTVIAMMAAEDVGKFRTCYQALTPLWESAHGFDESAKRAAGVLLDMIFTMARTVDDWYGDLPEDFPARVIVHRIVAAQLRAPLNEAIGCYKYADEDGWFALEGGPLIPDPCRDRVQPADFILSRPFHPVWIAGQGAEEQWDLYLSGIEKAGASFAADGKTARDRLTALFEAFHGSLRQISQESKSFFERALNEWPSHEPHMALFLAFLRLFSVVQARLNRLTESHLDFYYEKVLQFVPLPEEPDRVHVLFELAKQASPHLLRAGTLLEAGKDSGGNEVRYQLDRDIVVNNAQVSQLKTIFVERANACSIHASPVANSSDGQGKPFYAAEPRWKTFGQSQQVQGSDLGAQAKSVTSLAEIGFAIASPILQLNEGTRTITVEFTLASSGSPQPAVLTATTIEGSQFKVALSGEKRWLETAPQSAVLTGTTFTVSATLDPAFPPVVAYNSKVLGGSYGTNFPILKVTLEAPQKEGLSYAYEQLKDLEFTSIDLTVDVEGVKNLIVQNDLGMLDAAKPFMPFGPAPGVGSSLYIGSDEVFRKEVKIADLQIHTVWLDPNNDLADGLDRTKFTADVYVLKRGRWDTEHKGTFAFLVPGAVITSETVEAGAPWIERAVHLDPVRKYDNSTQQGFIKLELASPTDAFGHADFPRNYTKKVIELSKTDLKPDQQGYPELPRIPYTPVIASLTLDYLSTVTIPLQALDTSEPADKYYHLYPFGCRQVDRNRLKAVPLLCQFKSLADNTPRENEGELYIGLTGLKPRQNLSLLFQVAEGSADPELPKQEVHWSYLSGNSWQPFRPAQIIADSTNGLLASGIITFDVPESADTEHTMLPSGLHWLRTSVVENSRAVCDLIDVRAQAACASFVNRGNVEDFLARSLAKDSISKLEVKQTAIKSVSQPYASFGGRVRERGQRYCTRVSERLRHKARGVTVWDYERLVLERFPGVYKVKCINHSTYNFRTDDLEIRRSEFAPGFVTVIVIPDLNNKYAVNPLEPRASLHLLEEIRTFLCGRISPFARRYLRVINPLYEQVQVKLSVALKPGRDWGYYQNELNKEIVHFLSPWAFEEGQDIIFGGRLHKSVIVNFVEERDYVDYLTGFQMNQFVNDRETKRDINEALPTTARSVLVSHSQHEIEPAKREE